MRQAEPRRDVDVLTTLTTGLIMAHSTAPDDFDDEVIVAAFEALDGPEAPK